MTNNEKIRIIADWFGLKRVKFGRTSVFILPSGYVLYCDGAFNDLDACAEFEKVAEERGKLHRYLSYLWNTVEDPHSSNDPGEHIEEIWLATPEQRVNAILQVIKEMKP